MLTDNAGPFVKEIVHALEARGWLVPLIDRQGTVTRVHFMHPLAHGGAYVGYSAHDLRTKSSAQLMDQIIDDIVVAESIARITPWPPCDDEPFPIHLAAPPPHIRAQTAKERRHLAMPALGTA